MSALRYIFGDVIDVVAGTSPNASIGSADTAFANMIGMMNAGLIFLAAIYLAWVTIVGTLYTADKGEIFGQKWSVIWMPIKTTLGVSAIFLRIDFGPGYRLYVGRDGDDLVILLGGRAQAVCQY